MEEVIINPFVKAYSSNLEDFCQRYQVRRLAVFGSALRDDFGPESDIDILILFESETRVSFLTLGQMRRELSQIFRRPVDLIPQEGLKPAIRDEILSSIKVLYAA